MPKALATYFATVNDMPDTEFKVEIQEDGPVKKVSVNGKIYDVDYNVGGDSIHSIILNHKSHGVQITNIRDDMYEVKNKGDYFQVQVIDELKKMRLSYPVGSCRPPGHHGPDAGSNPESKCKTRRRSKSRNPSLRPGCHEDGKRDTQPDRRGGERGLYNGWRQDGRQ